MEWATVTRSRQYAAAKTAVAAAKQRADPMAGICLPVPGTRQEAAITQMSSGHSKFPRWRNKWRRTSPTGCSCGKRKSSTYKTEYTPPPAGTARKACDPPIIKCGKGNGGNQAKQRPLPKVRRVPEREPVGQCCAPKLYPTDKKRKKLLEIWQHYMAPPT